MTTDNETLDEVAAKANATRVMVEALIDILQKRHGMDGLYAELSKELEEHTKGEPPARAESIRDLAYDLSTFAEFSETDAA